MSWKKWLRRKWDLLAEVLSDDEEIGVWEVTETQAEKHREKPTVSTSFRYQRRRKRQARRARGGSDRSQASTGTMDGDTWGSGDA